MLLLLLVSINSDFLWTLISSVTIFKSELLWQFLYYHILCCTQPIQKVEKWLQSSNCVCCTSARPQKRHFRYNCNGLLATIKPQTLNEMLVPGPQTVVQCVGSFHVCPCCWTFFPVFDCQAERPQRERVLLLLSAFVQMESEASVLFRGLSHGVCGTITFDFAELVLPKKKNLRWLNT